MDQPRVLVEAERGSRDTAAGGNLPDGHGAAARNRLAIASHAASVSHFVLDFKCT